MDTVPPTPIHATLSLTEACALMLLQQTHRCRITDDSNQTSHILYRADLLQLLASEPSRESETLLSLINSRGITNARYQRLATIHQCQRYYLADQAGRFIHVSDALAELFNTTSEALLGQSADTVFPLAQARRLNQWHADVLQAKSPTVKPLPFAGIDGTHITLLTLMPISEPDSPSEILGLLTLAPSEWQPTEVDRITENELETIFQSLPDLFFRLASDGTILDYRAQQSADLYMPPEQFLGKRMQEILPCDLAELFTCRMDEQKSTGELITYEYDLPIGTGTARFEARLRDLPGTDEIIVIVRNITEQYREHQARIRAEQQLSLALEAAKEGVWDWDIRAGLWSANARFFTMLGFPPAVQPQPIHHWNTKIHNDDVERRKLAYGSLLTGDSENLDVDFRVLNSDGGYQWVRARGKVVERSPDGLALRAVGTHEEVSERKMLEERLKLAATVFENTAEGVIIANPRGHIIEVNQGFVDVTGFSRDEVLGRHVRLLNSGRQAPAFYRTIWRALLTEGSWQGEIWNRRKDGQTIPEWLNINAVYDDNQQISHFVAVFSDISVLKRSEEKLDHMAHHDALTGLPNRLMLQARLGRALVHASRNQSLLALLFLDVDRFKKINDSMGHTIGDGLLKQVGKRLKSCVRAEDTVARLGGDEFVVLLENLPNGEAAALIAEKILRSIREPFDIQGKEFYTTTSIGISVYPNDGKSPADLLRNADTAMYQVKQKGRDSYSFYTEHLTTNAQRKAEMESELHRAILNNELMLQYQPQFNLNNEELVGMEALVRWNHPVKGMIPPDLFIPLAEESGLINKISEWVCNAACQQVRIWLDKGFRVPRVAVNVSGAELMGGNLLTNFTSAMSTHRIAGSQLEAEITENFMMQDVERAVGLVNELRDLGIVIAVDDFGTGYSSLAYLKTLPIHRLKIDRTFVREIPNNVNDMAITHAIIAMGESLGLEILAEGIETREQQAFLRSKGCSLGQGYLFARPLSAENIEGWLAH
ncbi:bifunctional diguanylate cyclase/phosphodiesterase [Simiduia aestuariiviva]|uniref:cyclic-guanylate-specific phosphodiesterase n=1 Tax=Simiduia aestuariiviva TaxID=1510459 RepID=A0A839UWC1_9GAMM|nr:EAL domain-containing protein [Simiduia aestuariiviva]MBB3169625.1 diguanylate cyclase (GGDEF)-like protein/PAS domain S-box-containing protein [Simiduia aestuariiviva]